MRAMNLLASAVVCSLVCSAANAAVIPIPGGSFEVPDLAAGAFTVAAPASFGAGADVGIHRIGEYGSPAASAATDGDQLVFLGNGANSTFLFTDVTNALIGDPAALSYTFTVALSTRSAAGAESNSTINVGIQNLNVLSNNTDNGVGIVTPVLRATLGNNRGWQEFSVTLPALGVDPGDGIRLYVDKLAGSSLMVADNFRLVSNVPEPTSLTALALGGLMMRRRRAAR